MEKNKISLLIAKSSINGPFSIAMLNYQRVYLSNLSFLPRDIYIYIPMYRLYVIFNAIVVYPISKSEPLKLYSFGL